MAKVIGHNKLWYKAICAQCKAIILFEDNELKNHTRIDNLNEQVYDHSTCICPECGNELSFSKRFAAFSENTDEPIREVKKQSITIQIDKSVYEKAVSDMNVLVGDVADYEACHQEADKILMKFLESIGCNELVETFDAVGKWYS